MTPPRIAFSTLLTHLTDPDCHVRREAITSILRRRSEREQALSALVKLITDPDDQVYKAAIKAVVTIDHSRSFSLLEPLLSAPGSRLTVRRRVFLLKALAQVDYVRTVRYWLDALGEQSRLMKKAASTALNDVRAFDPLVSALSDPDPSLRLNAVESLRILGDAQALDALIAALSDPSERVRQSAAWALGEVGDVRALAPLRTVLSDPSMAYAARNALARLGACV